MNYTIADLLKPFVSKESFQTSEVWNRYPGVCLRICELLYFPFNPFLTSFENLLEWFVFVTEVCGF